MYQAIVFLPLIGAILAGVIALVGAHARNPSGDAVEHHGDAHGHGASAPIGGDAAVIHVSHDEPLAHDEHGHDDHGPVEPAAVGSRAAELITTGLLFVSMGLSWMAFVDVGFLHHDARIALFPWITGANPSSD